MIGGVFRPQAIYRTPSPPFDESTSRVRVKIDGLRPPGLTPPPRPPRSERATPDPTPPGFSRQQISRDDVEEDVRALIASADRDEVAMNTISGLYRRKYGRMLDYKSLGFAKMTAFVAEIPGLELVNGAAGGSVRLARAAPHRMIYDDETDSELEGYA